MGNKKTSNSGFSIVIVLGVAVLIAVLFYLWMNSQSPPQLGYDAEVIKTVDALFTAVTSQDSQRLAECEQRLLALQQAGRMPAEAATSLNSHIQLAKSGDWDSAAKKLYRFMLGQRGE